MSAAAQLGRRIGNELYKAAFPIYRPLYSVFKRYADRAERRLIASHLAPGSVAADVGANIGIYSQFLAKCVGPAGAVHSFEPCPSNFARLHAALSSSANVRLNQLAVSDETGDALLYVSPQLNVDHRLYASEGEKRQVLSIQSIRLDDYFKPGTRVAMIKMDIQGYELHALRGANRVLADNPDIIVLLEFWPHGLKQAGANWVDLIATLEAGNMIIRQVTSKGLIPFRPGTPSENADWYVNLFASRR
ncbi:MAG TPA: FkbM family methyltransferase [Chthoniobacterales bacterium]|jgi:FkbM family methyltransferase